MAVYEKDTKIFYFSSCNGGVLKTTDGGKTSKFVFDKIGSASIGYVAISQKNPDLVWVGTGDKWQRNSVGMGDGIYKSIDGGKTWQDMGLKKSVSISKIAIDPTNDDIVMVAALGSPWGYGPDRGIYKTTDGGKNWRKVLYKNEKCAGDEVVIDPKNPKNMIAALYDHIHYPYAWWYGGTGTGIYRSTDGGETWHQVTKGLPSGKLGRIALDLYHKDPKQAVAVIEEEKGSGLYRSWDGGETWQMMPAVALDRNGKPDKDQFDHRGRPFYDQEVKFDPQDSNKIYWGSLYHKSLDGGKTFLNGLGDSHGIWLDPNNSNHGLEGHDGGITQMWDIDKAGTPESKAEDIVLPSLFQTYGCGYDMRKLYWVMGNSQDDQGYSMPSQSTNRMRENGDGYLFGTDWVRIGGDECGGSMADPDDWTTVYSAVRCRSLTRADLKTGEIKTVIQGLDGYSSPHEFERYKKMNPPLRASWYTYFQISPWNSKTLYIGDNHLYRSVDRGDHWERISPDLSHNNPALLVSDEEMSFVPLNESSINRTYQSIVTICESPLKQGMIWVGTDDGYVQLTKDGGKTWENMTKNISGLPEYSWCSRIDASHFEEGRAYVSFDNHRNFDHKTYLYVTDDYGKSWTKINGNMPDEPCRVIVEGLKNPDLLFVGTEFGLHISLDRGKSWDYYQDWKTQKQYGVASGYFPRVSIHDLRIHPRELDLIIGSHGRGIWTVPIRPLEELTAENRAKDVYFTRPGNMYLFPAIGTFHPDELSKTLIQTDNTQPGTLFAYYLKQEANGEATINIQNAGGEPVMQPGGWKQPPVPLTIKGTTKAGMNTIQWMNTQRLIEKPGDYRAVLTIDGKEYYQTLHVEDVTNEVLAGMKVVHPKKQKEIANNRD